MRSDDESSDKSGDDDDDDNDVDESGDDESGDIIYSPWTVIGNQTSRHKTQDEQ